MGKNGPKLAFVSSLSLFWFLSTGSLLLPPRKHPEFVIIHLVIASYQDSPREADYMSPNNHSKDKKKAVARSPAPKSKFLKFSGPVSDAKFFKV